jgi:hypothetical protein
VRFIAFILLVLFAGAAHGAQPADSGPRNALLSWLRPTEYTNGTPMPANQIGGYRIYRKAPLETGFTRISEVSPTTLQVLLTRQPPGMNYYAVTAVTIAGTESAFSAIGSKLILLEPPTDGAIEAPTDGAVESPDQ